MGARGEARQRRAIEAYAKSAGMIIVDWFYDAAVSGADPFEARPGFAACRAGERDPPSRVRWRKALLPAEVVRPALADGGLVELLPDFSPPSHPMHLLQVSDRRLTPKLKSFIDFAVARFASANL